MIAQQGDVWNEMTNEIGSTLVHESDHLDRLLLSENETSWLKSFVQNVKETINPPKLPPLELTSTPVAVKDIWGNSGDKRTAGVTSLLVHTGAIALLLALGTSKAVQQKVKDSVSLVYPDLAPLPQAPPKKQAMGGGGGGGDRSPLQASKGKLPKIAPRQFVPPTAVINNPDPKLVLEPTIVVQPNAQLPNVNSVIWATR
ncbi:MAG: hypothetical protein WKF37_04110 [Bryobacteraceae bacterium]